MTLLWLISSHFTLIYKVFDMMSLCLSAIIQINNTHFQLVEPDLRNNNSCWQKKEKRFQQARSLAHSQIKCWAQTHCSLLFSPQCRWAVWCHFPHQRTGELIRLLPVHPPWHLEEHLLHRCALVPLRRAKVWPEIWLLDTQRLAAGPPDAGCGHIHIHTQWGVGPCG